MADILDVDTIYTELKQGLKRAAAKLRRVALASLKVSNDYSLRFYLSSQKHLASELGIELNLIELSAKASINTLLKKIEELNCDKRIKGILINKPLPCAWDEGAIASRINVAKDIEGMNPCNIGKIFSGEPLFISPTVLSILECIKRSRIKMYGKDITIVGFSSLIGKPLAIILGKMFATVSITHIATYKAGHLPFYIKNADILISAVGKPHIIKGNWIKPGAVVVDVGTSRKDGKLVGDVEFESALKRASLITPVPGGVGRLTTLFLFKNFIKAALLDK